jgi:cytochrome c1
MKKILLTLLVTLPVAAWSASASNWPMEEFEGDLQNLPSLQNGFKLYANYCIGCHGLQFQRYERTADDLGIPHDLALKNLIFTDQKIGDLMTTSDAQRGKQVLVRRCATGPNDGHASA